MGATLHVEITRGSQCCASCSSFSIIPEWVLWKGSPSTSISRLAVLPLRTPSCTSAFRSFSSLKIKETEIIKILNQTRPVIKTFVLILGETDHILHIYFAIHLQVLSCPKEYVQQLELRKCQMVYNLDGYLTTEYYFSPHCLQQNISVNSEISFFAQFQVPILHKSECEEPTPKVSQKSICGFPSQAAGCRCIFIEKDRRGGGCTRKKGYREHLDGLHTHFLFLQLL